LPQVDSPDYYVDDEVRLTLNQQPESIVMTTLADAVRETLVSILIFIGLIWAVFLLSRFLPGITDYGLLPRSAKGLIGIGTMPFLHAHLGHIVANTIPLLVLLFLLAGSRAQSWPIVLEIVVFSGVLLWTFGRKANHIGASGLVFGLIGFLIFAGVFERRFVSIVVALITLVLYGGSMLWGMLPIQEGVSWDGHLCGAIAGGLLAFQMARGNSRSKELVPS
jgi:membrane associated rhomboid family serine protease